jgi:imidazolonepropionase-like amidohydrolase
MRNKHVLAGASLFLLLALSVGAGANRHRADKGESQQRPVNLVIVGGRLLDGWGGPPLEHAVVLVRGDEITAVGRQGDFAVPADCKVIDASGMTIMPGLIDLHVHLDDVGHADLHYPGKLYQQGKTKELMARMAQTLLLSGVTTARDLGAPLDEILELRDKINRGELPGARLFVAGPVLAKAVAPDQQVDHWRVEDPMDARRKVQELVARGVDWIKIVDTVKMSQAEVSAIVEEAHKAGKPVAAHAIYPVEIRALFNAGFNSGDTFEHTGLVVKFPLFSEDLLSPIIEKEISIVPTIIVIETFSQIESYPGWLDDPGWRDSLPPDVWREVRSSLDQYQKIWFYDLAKYGWDARRSRLRQLVKAGARIALGSDSGARANPHNEAAWREMELMEEIGMSPMEVIMGSTRIPAVILRQGDKLGTIEPGKKADIVVINGDPLQSMVYLRFPAHVIKDGVIIN